jgi:hypothetical protein
MNPIIFDGTKEQHALSSYPVINDDNYYDDRTYITNSMLSMLNQSPQDLRDYLAKTEKEENDAFLYGEIFHKSILEPDKLSNEILVWSESAFPEKGKTLRTKANREWFAKLKAMNPDRLIIKDKDYQVIMNMKKAIESKSMTDELLTQADYESISLCMINGIPMKSKADVVCHNEWIVDLKTTKSVDIDEFKQSCEKYGYYRQAALYCKMFNKQRFGFYAVEKSSPYKVAFYEVSKENLKKGWEDVMTLIEQYKHYFVEDMFQERIDDYVITGTI